MASGEELYCEQGQLFWHLGHLRLSYRDAMAIVAGTIHGADESECPLTAEGQRYSLRYHHRANRWTLRHLGPAAGGASEQEAA